jgi:hypothetical protein
VASPDIVLTTTTRGDLALPVNPFVSNRYHFGMLLGVADLDTDQGYHRGKTWLHTAWLHGVGTVWGLPAELRPGTSELAVGPGLAVDGRGRELFVAEPLCVDLGQWFGANRPEDLQVTDDGQGGVSFDLQLVLCSQQCLDRPVPAIADSCEGSGADTAYSRAVEQGLPVLRPRPAPAASPGPYPRVHQLLGLAEAADPLVTQALADIAAADPADRLDLSRRGLATVLAADAIDRTPTAGVQDLFPEPEPACVPLAELHVHLAPAGTGWRVVEDGTDPTTVDDLVRPAVAPTSLLQDLLVPPAGLPPPGGPHPAPAALAAPAAPAAGQVPQLIEDDASVAGRTLKLRFTAALEAATVQAGAFTVTALKSSGWEEVPVRSAGLEGGTSVTLTLGSAVRARPVRVVVQGAGPRPLLGTDGAVLGGGRDAAVMIRA